MLGMIPFLGYHHVLMILLVAGIILTCKLDLVDEIYISRSPWYLIAAIAILLAGCSSYSTMTNVYILGLSYTDSIPSNLNPIAKNLSETLQGFRNASQLEVRTGYFGICVRQRGIIWLCSSDSDGLIQQIGPENDPLNLIGLAAKFKDDVLFSGLLFMVVVLAFLSFILLSTFPGWHEERDERTGSDVDVKPFPSRPVSQVALSCAFVAGILSLISTLWQHVGSVGAAAMAESAHYGTVKSSIGTSAMAMGWVAFSLIILVAVGLLIMILSIIVLDHLTDD
jgi:hypothetical protein